jgi:hypothetical protein
VLLTHTLRSHTEPAAIRGLAQCGGQRARLDLREREGQEAPGTSGDSAHSAVRRYSPRMATDLVFIYATGGDSLLREVCWDLLERGQAIDADLIGQSPAFINDRGKRKTGMVGRAVAIVVPRAELDAVTARLRQAKAADSRVRAYFMPVLGSIT